MNMWANHPNANHIDRVFDSARKNPMLWIRLGDSKYKLDISSSKSEYLIEAENICKYKHIFNEVIVQAYYSICSSNLIADAVSDVVCALVTYTDCAYMLDSVPGELAILAGLGDNRAKLLLPAAIVFDMERHLE